MAYNWGINNTVTTKTRKVNNMKLNLSAALLAISISITSLLCIGETTVTAETVVDKYVLNGDNFLSESDPFQFYLVESTDFETPWNKPNTYVFEHNVSTETKLVSSSGSSLVTSIQTSGLGLNATVPRVFKHGDYLRVEGKYQYNVIRFTAPSDGNYKFTATCAIADTDPAKDESGQANWYFYTGNSTDGYDICRSSSKLSPFGIGGKANNEFQDVEYTAALKKGDTFALLVWMSKWVAGEKGIAIDYSNISVSKVDEAPSNPWLTSKEPVTDYAYSMCIVPDTQNLNLYFGSDFPDIYEYILANKDSKKIKFVLGLGDITDKSTDEEWVRAVKEFDRLKDQIPFSLVRGNHDTTESYNKYITYSKYGQDYFATYGTDMLNTCQSLVVGKVKYLIFALDLGFSDGVIDWAGKIIEENPDHNVIITTHAYLAADGTTLDSSDHANPIMMGEDNNGDHMWDKFISKYENISLVLCGHIESDEVVVTRTEGIHGNTVTQILMDAQQIDGYQGKGIPTGMIGMLYFSEDGSRVQVEYYSTVQQKYFMTENQFTMTLDVADPNAKAPSQSSSTTVAPPPNTTEATTTPPPPPSTTESTNTNKPDTSVTETEPNSSESDSQTSSDNATSTVGFSENETEPTETTSDTTVTTDKGSDSEGKNNSFSPSSFTIGVVVGIIIGAAGSITVYIIRKKPKA